MSAPGADVVSHMECWQCEAEEGRRAAGEESTVRIAVCHHCGKPLCQEHWKFVVDDAFSRETTADPPKAYHCSACWPHPGGPQVV
jgi:hypothetical protein